MGATSSPNNQNKFFDILDKVSRKYPQIKFEQSDSFYWSGKKKTIFYSAAAEKPIWSLLHEIGHMLNGDNTYKSDSELTKMEVLAWEKAKQIAKDYDEFIDEEYIQDCIDSYRNWQYMRSKCPVCAQTGLETKYCEYKCINCQKKWNVTENRFCRVYKKQKNLL